MGSVWKADDLRLRGPVAVKLIHRHIASLPGVTERLQLEVRAGAALRSAHVVQIFDCGVDEGDPYIAMELLVGESLAHRLARVRRLPPAETARFITHVARALRLAHEAGIIHRDLKPDNVFLVPNEDNETAKVLDFGVAKHREGGEGANLTRPGMLVGTLEYMSPEQMDGKAVDPRSDLWSLGVVAYECVVGEHPFKSEGHTELMVKVCLAPLPVPSQRASVPAGFDAWFSRACAREVEQRFPSAKELAEALRKVLAVGDASASLTFAVASGSRDATRHLARICRAIERGLGCPVRPQVLASHAALAEEVEEGRAQIAWAPPLVAIELATAGLATIDLCCARSERVEYHAAIFTPQGSKIETLSDLRGAHVAWVDPRSSSGFSVPRRQLVALGMDLADLFGRESFEHSHAGVARAVLSGEADVGATYVVFKAGTTTPEDAGWLEAGAGLHAVRILVTAGPIPADAIVFSAGPAGLPAELKAALVARVTALPASEPEAVSKLFGADGFAPPPASHYEAFRVGLAIGDLRQPVTLMPPSRGAHPAADTLTSVAAVVITKEWKKGALRQALVHAQPGEDEDRVGVVQPGTSVEIVDTETVEEKNGPKKWYRIRWVDGGTTHEGWTRSAVLKSVEDVPLP